MQTAALFITGGLGFVRDPSVAVKSGIIAIMIVMTLGFTIGWAATSHLFSAELPSMRLRDVTYRTASDANIATQFAFTLSMPYLLNEPYAALGSRVGLIFGSLCVLSLVFVYICVPECNGWMLEEIDLLFEAGVPMRHFDKTDLGNGEIR